MTKKEGRKEGGEFAAQLPLVAARAVAAPVVEDVMFASFPPYSVRLSFAPLPFVRFCITMDLVTIQSGRQLRQLWARERHACLWRPTCT